MYGFLAKYEKEGEQDVVQWQWKAGGGNAGTLMINDTPYMVDKGALFLVSTQDGSVRVKQFDKDALDLAKIPSYRLVENLQTLARNDRDISSFFVDATKRK